MGSLPVRLVQSCQDYYLHSLYLLHLHYPQCQSLSQSLESHLSLYLLGWLLCQSLDLLQHLGCLKSNCRLHLLLRLLFSVCPLHRCSSLLQTWYPHLQEVSLPLNRCLLLQQSVWPVQSCQDYYLHSLYLLHLRYLRCQSLSQSLESHLSLYLLGWLLCQSLDLLQHLGCLKSNCRLHLLLRLLFSVCPLHRCSSLLQTWYPHLQEVSLPLNRCLLLQQSV